MTHARESLEAFLGDVNSATPSDIMSERDIVRDIFPVIEVYRQRGYSLPAIHQALVRGGDLSCKITTFRVYYYQERHQRQPLSEQPLSEQNDVDAATNVAPVPADDMSPSTQEKVSADVPPASNTLFGMSEDELAAQQAFARRMFDQRRAELGMRRREK